jgi:hypothetical protein
MGHALNEAVAVCRKQRQQRLGQLRLCGTIQPPRKARQGFSRGPVDCLNVTAGIIDSLEHALHTREQAQEALDSGGGIGCSKLIRDGRQGRREVGDEGPLLLPSDDPARPLESRQTPVNDGCNGVRSLCGREGGRDDPLEAGVAGRLVQDELSQLLGAESNQRIMGQRCSACHSLLSPSAFARQETGLLNHLSCETEYSDPPDLPIVQRDRGSVASGRMGPD